ncbi:restriction endonuclease S subunit [Leptolyngbya sp. PCC 7375]|nr:restriction endonuclease S subunit [Leptolyngbya sp. PCC 7375]
MVYGLDDDIDKTLSLAMTLMRIIAHYSECDNPEGGMWVTPKRSETGVLLLSARNVQNGFLSFHKVDYVPTEVYESLTKRLKINSGDVLMSCSGTVGRSCVAPSSLEFALVRSVAVLKPLFGMGEFLSYSIRSPQLQRQINEKKSQTAQANIFQGKIKQLLFAVPPLAEQHRIVNKIEELFTQLDAGVDLLKKLKVKLKRYRQAVLKAVVEGKLTQAWRAAHQDELEPASVLLDRILKERREKWKADQLAKMETKGKVPKDDKWKLKYKEPAAPNAPDWLENLPKEWTLATVGQIAVLVQYGSSSKTNLDSSGIPVLRMGNIVEGKLVFDKLKYLPKDHKEFPELLLEPYDVLFNRTNSVELVGKTSVYEGRPSVCSFASYLIRVRIHTTLEPSFVSHYINSIYGRKWIGSVVSQQVGQANVNGTKLQALSIPLPPKQEQEEIFDRVEYLFSIIEELEKIIDKNFRRAEKLRQSILKKAFEGKLVPQDPNDEPASVLLERIQAEKAQQEAKSKKRKTTAKKKKSRKPTKTKQLEITDDSNEDQAS